MPHDPARVAEVRAWLSRARRDPETAEYEMRADPPFSGGIAFHSQQAVEEVLKAFHSRHGVAFRKTHNLVELGGASRRIEPALEPLLRRAAPLPESARRLRYAGGPEQATAEEAAEALWLEREVFGAVRRRLPPEARPQGSPAATRLREHLRSGAVAEWWPCRASFPARRRW